MKSKVSTSVIVFICIVWPLVASLGTLVTPGCTDEETTNLTYTLTQSPSEGKFSVDTTSGDVSLAGMTISLIKT